MENKRHKILIVDDTLANIEILSGILRREYQVFFAKSGEGALRLLERETPDLILLDIMMPDIDGYEVCKKLKGDPKHRNIPVIFVTAMSNEVDEERGLDCGAIDYITKPISAPIVKARIRNHLELKGSRDLLEALTVELARKNQALQQLATEDGLTGLANRRHFDEVLGKEVRRASHTRQYLSLILCDVDFFKRYNDIYGHLSGDQCLKHVAATLKGVFRRAGDLCARYGGEEFAVILPDTCPESAAALGETLCREMMQCSIPHEGSTVAPCVTMSAGVAGVRVTPEHPVTVEWLIKAADQALYFSKEHGRNRVTLWEAPAQEGGAALCCAESR